MKISLKWIQDFIEVKDFFANPEELAKILTAAGLEVESLENQAASLNHVVVGHLESVEKHPQADRLTLCQVNVKSEILQIVCGAKNHKKGDKVCVAKIGAVLPGNLSIQKTKLRGVDSFGMLCSAKELNLSSEGEGLYILPPDSVVGTSVSEVLGLNDVLLTLKVTPNRADCLSHWGLARELSSLTGRKLLAPKSEFQTRNEKSESVVKVDLRAKELCPRYSGCVVKGVKVGPSPQWLKSRIESVGLKSINNVVDITNYVMMELGQPLHAFDLRELKGAKIVIDRAKNGEAFQTLDGTDLKLTSETLVIRDGERSVAMAGVIGGRNSGIQLDTKDIFIESAYFVPQTVRKTSRSFGIVTDSAYRFARGTDPEMVPMALNRAIELVVRAAGGEPLAHPSDEYPTRVVIKPVALHHQLLEEKLGFSVEKSEFLSWMQRLNCKVEDQNGEYRIHPPTYRQDLNQDVDFIEEYARLKGYDQIPETLPTLSNAPQKHSEEFLLTRRITEFLAARGVLQAINHHFISAKFQDQFLNSPMSPSKTQIHFWNLNAIPLKNPLNEELNTMRVSLLPGLFKNCLQSYKYGVNVGRQFELGYVFGCETNANETNAKSKYFQSQRIAFVSWGHPEGLWEKGSDRPIVYDVKARVEELLHRMGFSPEGDQASAGVTFKWTEFPGNTPGFFHPKRCAQLVVGGKPVGVVGALHPHLESEEKLRVGVALAELELDSILKVANWKPQIREISKYQRVERDLAFLVPKTLVVGDLLTEMRILIGETLQTLWVQDIYEGDAVPLGTRSVAFRMELQSLSGTLTDEALNATQNKVITGLKEKFGVELR